MDDSRAVVAHERLHHGAAEGGCHMTDGGRGLGDGDDSVNDAIPDSLREKGVSRRRALQILGAVPVATALGAQQPTAPLTPGVTSQVPTKPGETVGASKGPRFFNGH